MEIVFLIIGLPLLAIGWGFIASEVQARRGKDPVQARVIGFSVGKTNNPNMPSFHTVAEYMGRSGKKYYVEGAVGSSVPLHAVGQGVTVLTNPRDPEQAALKSPLAYALGGVLASLGLAAVGLFWLTFSFSILSLVTAAVILGGLGVKIRSAWRTESISLEAWQAYKKKALAIRVFTEDSMDQIVWADPIRVASAFDSDRRANRFTVPILLVLAFGLLFAGYYFYEKTERFVRSADQAVGTVVDLHARDSNDGSYTYAAVVEYRDQRGANFKFVDSFSSSPPSYHTGETVHVLFSRENPKEAQIDRGIANYWVTALFGGLGALFLLMGLHSARKRFRSNFVGRSEVR
jgi:hypothetical protein